MFGITTLMNAFARLANALNGLAESAEQANVGIRQRLQLDYTEPLTNRLPGPEPEEAVSNGRKRKAS